MDFFLATHVSQVELTELPHLNCIQHVSCKEQISEYVK